MEKKYAVLTMDVEDWYHTGYLDRSLCDRGVSILSVLNGFADRLEKHGARGTFFVLGELVAPNAKLLNGLIARGHEIASHGWGHVPSLKLEMDKFTSELQLCQRTHADHLSAPLEGFRSPLFSMDRARLDRVMELGFLYDSSATARGRRANQFDLSRFSEMRKQVFRQNDFFEFQVGAPGLRAYFINGGGGTRLAPWPVAAHLLQNHLAREDFYSFYTHPIDVSSAAVPLPLQLGWLKRRRMLTGRAGMMDRFEWIVAQAVANGFAAVPFAQMRRELLAQPGRQAG